MTILTLAFLLKSDLGVGFWLQLGICVATSIIAVFSIMQGRASQRSADAFVESHRPLLIVRTEHPKFANGFPGAAVTGELVNIGLTAAYKCVLETWIEILPEPFTDFTSQATYFVSPHAMSLYPKIPEHTQFIISLERPLTSDEKIGLDSGNLYICFRILARYWDSFRKIDRYQNFGYMMNKKGLMVCLPIYNDSD